MAETPLAHYERNRDTYRQIENELSAVRTAFDSGDRFTKKVMLFDSSVFAVMSVQNSTDILRRAFRAYANSESWESARVAFERLNYGNNKFDYVRSNFETIFSWTGNEIITWLESHKPWKAVEIMAEELDGISWVKAPFIGAMLGVTDLMCIDTNVEQMIDDDSVKSSDYSSLEEYLDAIVALKQEYPELAKQVSTFMFQWILFDANRGDNVTRHEEWFEHILPGTVFGRQTALDQF